MTIRVDIRCASIPGALEDFDDGAFHAVLTDPPYGLGQLGARHLRAMLGAWLDGREATQGAGMLGRTWDVVVGPPTWAEIRRVCRPGALVFAYSHARTVHYQMLAMELAGWRILPHFVRIHGGAIALGEDTSLAIDEAAGVKRPKDKRKIPVTPLAYRFDGHATAVRNAIEPIVSAVNPPAGSWAESAQEYGCGGFNVGDSRITSGPDHAAKCASVVGCDPRKAVAYNNSLGPRPDSYDPRGRYPGNALLEHAAGCGADWCVEGCPVRTLGEMGRVTGGASSVTPPNGTTSLSPAYGARCHHRGRDIIDGGGGVSRFYYQGRASREERHRGAEGLLWRRSPAHPDGWELVDVETWEGLGENERMEGSPHLAVKAADGGSHLASLLRQPDGPSKPDVDGRSRMSTEGGDPPRLLVPFAGTGSEVIAAMLAGWRDIVAVEMSPQWCEVARRRIAWWREKIEAGSRGDALEILRDWGTTPGPGPQEDDGQLGLFAPRGGP